MEVLSADLSDVDHDAGMSPLAGDSNMGHDEVSELEQEAVALAAANMAHDDDDNLEGPSGDSHDASGSSSGVGGAVVTMSENGILLPGQTAQAIVGATSEQVIGLLLQTSESGGVKLSVAGMLPEGAVVTTDTTAAITSIQAVTLADGSTAFIQHPKEGKLLEGQTVTLEDGSTAIVQGSITPKVETDDGDSSGSKVLEAQTIQLEDGTTAFLQPTTKAALSEGLQAIQLEDGTTAYIAHPNAEALFGEAGTLDAATLDSLASQVHERSHTGDRPFKCDYSTCGKAFATGYGLKSHTRVHTGEKPYPCPEENCDKAFKTSGDLQKHVRTHTGERPFKCPFEGCNRSFTTSNIRKVHIRTHTGERPYLCTAEGCGRAFASATNYKNHVRIHTGEKPYVCTVQGCGKRFTEYSSLYKHHVVHTHSKPYICNYCGKTYRQTSTLAMHKRTAHGEDCTAESEAQLFAQQQDDKEDSNGEPDRKRQRLQFSLHDGEGQGTEEGEGTLVINTSDAQQVVADLAQQASTSALVTLPAQVTLQALQAQGLTSFTVGEHGQQVLVVTDPSQLEALQQFAQQHLESAEVLDIPVSSDSLVSQNSSLPSASSPTSSDASSLMVFPAE